MSVRRFGEATGDRSNASTPAEPAKARPMLNAKDGPRIASLAAMTAKLLLLVPIFVATCALAATPEQTLVRYVDLPPGAQPRALAADAAGNLFIVSNIVEPSGRPQIRALKTDSQGQILASLDFGGSLGSDTIAGAVVDSLGNLVIAGSTTSPDFPLVSPLITSTSLQAAFVTKIDSQLQGILFSTRVGGTQEAAPFGSGTTAGALILDSAGNVYITGSTFNTDFPITPGAFQSQPPPSNPFGAAVYAYLTEISSDGKGILFSTYFGNGGIKCNEGSQCIGAFGSTAASAIALDSAGNVIIAGNTTTNQLPVTPGVYAQQCACNLTLAAGFLAKFTAGGSGLAWATYLPVAGVQVQADIHVSGMSLDNAGNVVVGGSVGYGLPVTPGALQNDLPAGFAYGGFVTKFDPDVQRLLVSTYFGGVATSSNPTGVAGLAVDSQGAIWITGGSDQKTLPIPHGTPLLGNTYVVSLSSDGSTVTSAFTAPTGAAGEAVALTGAGVVVALGTAGSLLLTQPASGPSLVGVANSAASEVSNAVAPYELISLYGIGLGPSPAFGAQIVNGALTSSLSGVKVLFDGVAAPLLYAGPTQINAIVPSEVTGRDTTSLTIVTPSESINGPTMPIRPSQPGVFGTATGTLPPSVAASALNQDGSLNSPANPAAGGSIVTVWATGGGVSTRPQPDGTVNIGPLGSPNLPLSVLNPTGGAGGGLSLEVLYGGDAPDMVFGVLQINFRLPLRPSSNLYPNPTAFFQLQIGDTVSDTFSIYEQP